VSLSGIGPRVLATAAPFSQQRRSVEWQVAGIERVIASLDRRKGVSNAVVKDWGVSRGNNDEKPKPTPTRS
jgi:hypothetical protein